MTETQEISLVTFIDKAEARFKNAPSDIVFESERSYAVQLLENNPYLKQVAEKAPASLLSAMSNVASIGISLNPAKKQAYLIPRSVKVGSQNGRSVYQTRIFLDVSYMGLCDIATGTGCVEWLQSEVVYENDEFVLNGINKEPTHIRDPFKDRGEFVGAYCVAKLPSGDFLTTAMSAEEINNIRDNSEAWKSAIKNKKPEGAGPWKDFPNEMRKKTVVRNQFKMLPKNKDASRMSDAVEISNNNEGIELIINNPDIKEYTADQKAYFNQMIEKSDAIGMFCFMKSIPEGVYVSLYNSFSSDITKFKRIVGDLEKNGAAQILDCKSEIEISISNDDEMGAKQIIEDLSTEAVNFILDNTDDETRRFIQSLDSE